MCVFCNIIHNKIPAKIVFENEHVLAFEDINPLAPVHIVVIPKECRPYFHELSDDNYHHLCQAIKVIVQQQNLTEKGYRLINNNGEHGAQSVFHAHIHILGGISLGHNLAG